MTAPSAFRRAGGDRPHRRPDRPGWLATRAALLLLPALLLVTTASGRALAAPPDPTSPVIGPGPAVPPPPPTLPGSKAGKGAKRGKATHKAKAKRGGKAAKGRKDKAKDAVELQGSCSPLGHTQSYEGWGPAVAYGKPVTVVYQAARCSTPDGSALDLSAEGTAQIFDGPSAAGALLDTRPFLVTGTWRKPKNAEAWPPTWWACDVPFASYTWQIPGVYSFRVSARDGVWSLDVSSDGAGSHSFSWTHDGCA